MVIIIGSVKQLLYMICLQDYGIDFDDHDHPIKPFQCRCGSKFCRNMKRPNSKYNLLASFSFFSLEVKLANPSTWLQVFVCFLLIYALPHFALISYILHVAGPK